MRFWLTLATFTTALGAVSPAFAQGPDSKPIGMLLAAGDISTCKEDKDEEWKKYADQTAALIRDVIKEAEAANPPIPYRVLALGDLAYDKGTGDQFKCFAQRWTFDDAVMLPVPGNHEYLKKKAGQSTDAGPYFDHFASHPVVNQNGSKKGYFAVNFPRADGPWHLIGLNDNFESASKYKSQMEAQTAWLEKDLADNLQNCVLAFWHAPPFSFGRHGHDYKTPPNTPLSKERHMLRTFSLLYGHGASAVLTGHEHSYEQFRPQNPDGKSVADGLRLFVIGTGGALLTEDVYDHLEESSEGGAFGKTRGIQGVLKIMLFETSYKWEFVSIDQSKKLELKTTSDDCRKRK